MKYTVLGAGGFIGSHLVQSLRSRGVEVDAPAKQDSTLLSRRLGHVIYCIGLTADFRRRPFDTMRAHSSVLADVLEFADFESLVYLSSTRVYARAVSGDEGSPLVIDSSDPSDLYNISKLAGEALCRCCGRAGVRVARVSNVVGRDPSAENFLFALIRDALTGRIQLDTHLESSKDYVMLEDVISIIPEITARGNQWLYNVASGSNLRHRQLVERLVELTGCELQANDSAPLHQFPYIGIQRIRNEFEFSPKSVLDALPELVSEYQRFSRINF